jgi:hypothetical protein
LKTVVFAVVVLSAGALFAASQSSEVASQECGYSINTIYVTDTHSKPIANVRISVGRKEPTDEYNEHFRVASKIYWDDERKAYVYLHGLCGAHRDLVLKVSADGFETMEAPIDLPLGPQAFAVTLKRKGTQEVNAFKMLSCAEATTQCVRTIQNRQ